MALLTNQQMTSAGGAITLTAAAGGGDTLDVGNGRTFLWVKNGGGSAITVTITTPGTVDGLAITDRTVSVPNGGERLIGPLSPSVYADSTGVAAISYSGVTSVTVAGVSV